MVRLCSIALGLLILCASLCRADDAAIDALINKLGSSEPAERDAAYSALDAKGAEAEPRLRARRKDPDAEVRVQIEKLLTQRSLDPLRKTRLVLERRVTVTGGRVNCAAWSPDGSLLATGGGCGDIVLWNTRNWQPIQTVDGGDGNVVETLVFAADGKRLWSTTACVTAWDVNGTLAKACTFEQRGRSFALSRDGRWAAWDTRDEGHLKIVIADARSLKIADTLLVTDRGARISAIAFPPDGNSVVVRSRDGKVATWPFEPGRKPSEEVRFPEGISGVYTLEWLADGTPILAGERGKISWGKTSVAVPEGCPGFAISLDGRRIAFGTDDGKMSIATPSLEKTETWSSSGDYQIPFAWSPDGSTLAATGPEGLRIWKDGKASDYRAHGSLPCYMAFSGDSQFLAIGDRRRTVFANLETGATQDLPLKASLSTGASGTDILVLTADKAALWNAETGQERIVLRQGIKETEYPFVSLSPDGKSLLWCSDRERIAILPAGDGPARELPETIYPYSPQAFRWSPDSKFAVVGGIFVDAGNESQGLSVLTADGHLVHHLRLDRTPHTVEWSPDGHFVWWSAEEQLNRMDVRSGQTEVMLGQRAPAWQFLDDSLAVCNGEEGVEELWHVPTMSKLCTWPNQANWGPGVLSPDRKRFAINATSGVTVYSFQK